MRQPEFKQWDHLEPADKARRIEIVSKRLKREQAGGKLPSEGMNAHAIFCVAARLDGNLELAQEFLNVAVPYSQANTRYATWVKFRRLEKPFAALLALAQKSDLLADTKQLLANDLSLSEEQQLFLIQETNPQLVGDVGANPAATPQVMDAVSEFKNVISRARLAENPGLPIPLMEKLLADKRQTQLGLAKNWMITDEIKQKLFETLDPEIVHTLAIRRDQDVSEALEFGLAAIAKHESASSFDIQNQVRKLKLWVQGHSKRSPEALPEISSTVEATPASRVASAPAVENFFIADPNNPDEAVKRHRDLGYQYPEIPEEWLLKNVKNRADEIKKDVLLNPSLPVEAMRVFALDKKPEIRNALALLPNCPDEIRALVALQ